MLGCLITLQRSYRLSNGTKFQQEQYGFIYMALLESITCGNTEIPSCDLRVALRKLASINPKTKTSGLASEYQVYYCTLRFLPRAENVKPSLTA